MSAFPTQTSAAVPSPAAPEPEFVLRGHGSAVNSIAFVALPNSESYGNRVLCSGSLDGTLKVWDLSTRRAKVSIKNAHSESSITSVVAAAGKDNNNSPTLVTSGRDGMLKLWDLNDISSGGSSTPVKVYHTSARHFCNIAIDSTHPHMILSPFADESEVVLIDKRCHAPQVHLKAPATLGMITALQIDGCGTHANSTMLGFEGGSVATVDLRNYTSIDLSPTGSLSPQNPDNTRPPEMKELSFHDGRPTMLFESMHGGQPVLSVAMSRGRGLVEQEGFNMYTVGADRTMNRITVEARGAYKNTQVQHPSAGTSSVALRLDGKLLASGHWDSTVRIFDTKDLRPLAVLRHHRDCVFSVAWAPPVGPSSGTGQTLASASKDGTIALWNLFGGK